LEQLALLKKSPSDRTIGEPMARWLFGWSSIHDQNFHNEVFGNINAQQNIYPSYWNMKNNSTLRNKLRNLN
jgi:hypothetical protein